MRHRSRTENPEGAPYQWERYVSASGVRVVENELDECLQTGCRSQFDYDLCHSEIEVRLQRAAAGQLGVAGVEPAQPVRSQPELWEIRWAFDSRQLRLYHAEPASHPQVLLELKYHWKVWQGLAASDIEARQNQQMSEAAQRYRLSRVYET